MRAGTRAGQRRSTPSIDVWLIGSTLRAGYKIPMPAITSLGGAPAIPMGGKFEQSLFANMGTPIFSAVWALKFRVTAENVNELTVPPNPALLTDEQ